MQAHFSYPFLAALAFANMAGIPFSAVDAFFVIGSSMLPDLDYFVALWEKKRHPERTVAHHSYITHVPVVYVPVVLVVWALGGAGNAAWTAYGILSHFIMDTFIAADGVRWLYPWKKKFFCWTTWTYNAHGKEWLIQYRALPIYRLDMIFFAGAVVVLITSFLLS